MTAKQYFFKELPKRCGVHPACGKVVEQIYLSELAGEEAFSRSEFKTVRDRARLALPYRPAPGYEQEWNHGLDVATLFLLDSDLSKGIAIDEELHEEMLSNTYDEIEMDVLKQASDWWNG